MSRDILYSKPGPPFSWYPVNEVWTYASAAAPTFTLTIPGDHSMTYWPKQRVRLTQTTVKYFIITKVAYSAPDTTLTLYGGTDYALTADPIVGPAFSMDSCPMGFPMDPAKWTVLVTDTENKIKNTPITANVWYGGATGWGTGANLTITVPIGVWDLSYQAPAGGGKTAAVFGVYVALSTTNAADGTGVLPAMKAYQEGSVDIGLFVHRECQVNLPAAQTYWLMMMTATASVSILTMYNALGYAVLQAKCAYL